MSKEEGLKLEEEDMKKVLSFKCLVNVLQKNKGIDKEIDEQGRLTGGFTGADGSLKE